jgi:hypothetical protein
LHTKLANSLATFDGGLREFALCLLEREDALFNGVVNGKAVDSDVDGLIEAVDTIDCLFFDKLGYG